MSGVVTRPGGCVCDIRCCDKTWRLCVMSGVVTRSGGCV